MSDLYLARAIHFDESDRNVFHVPARTGEWCVSGGFEFSNWTDGDLTGKARPVAEEEVSQMMEICADHAPNTLLTVGRELTESGVREGYRFIEPQDAGIDQFAVHGSLDDDGHGGHGHSH